MAESNGERKSRLPDQEKEIKKRKKGKASQMQPEDYPQGLVEKDEIADEEKDTGYDDIEISRKQRGNPDDKNPMDGSDNG